MEFKLYSFVNFYLSDLQRGLQTAHVVGELCKKYATSGSDRDSIFQWLNKDKSILIFNGGNHKSLTEFRVQCAMPENSYPYAYFNEDWESLNDSCTAVGILLPDKFERPNRKKTYEETTNPFDKLIVEKLFNTTLA
jgi:hypothetical protein